MPISGGYITVVPWESQPKPSGMSTGSLQGLVDPIHSMEDHDFALLKRESLAVAKNSASMSLHMSLKDVERRNESFYVDAIYKSTLITGVFVTCLPLIGI